MKGCIKITFDTVLFRFYPKVIIGTKILIRTKILLM
jgi:hypothetical protein